MSWDWSTEFTEIVKEGCSAPEPNISDIKNYLKE